RPSTENTSNGKKQLIQTITLGKTPIREAILSDANRAWANNLHKQFVEPIQKWRDLRVERGERLKNPFGGLALPITIEQTDDMGDHERALVDHRNTLHQLAEMIEKNLNQPSETGAGVNRPPRPVNYSTPENVIWDEKALEEFATGKIANVFGHEYAIIDTYKSRVRLPAHPYLLVTRITKLDAEIHQYRPSAMTTEYDIPFDA
ncbi:MAG: hypothetical protein KJ043_11505, partial [Anaerolineae bacterium]|nr:hypothetical protein [Anaerolineae bacterium]